MNPASSRWRDAAVVWAAVIFTSGVLPTQGAVATMSADHDWAMTTAAHFVAYMVLGFLLAVAAGGWQVRGRQLLVALLLAAALGGVIELLQGPLPYRDTQAFDFVVDVAGAAAGVASFSGATWAKLSRSHP